MINHVYQANILLKINFSSSPKASEQRYFKLHSALPSPSKQSLLIVGLFVHNVYPIKPRTVKKEHSSSFIKFNKWLKTNVYLPICTLLVYQGPCSLTRQGPTIRWKVLSFKWVQAGVKKMH